MFSTLSFLARANVVNRLTRSDPARVARLRETRFRKLLRAAVRAPLYRDKFRGLDLDRVPLDALPTLDKYEAMARFDEWSTDPAVTLRAAEAFVGDFVNVGKLFLGKYVLMHTSGSSGRAVVLVQPRAAVDLLFMIQMTRGNAGGDTGVREAYRKFRNPARLAIVTLKEGFYPTGATFEFYPRQLRHFVHLRRLSQTDPDVVAKLNDYSPTVLTAYATALLELADEFAAGRLKLPALKHVVNNSELLTEPARERLMEVFGVPVFNNYATAECMHLTTGCPTDPGMHVNADWSILEVVDADNRPVPAGQPGAKVLLTNLANPVQPVIRYAVPDRVTLAAGGCGCGSRLPRVERVEGRGQENFWARRGDEWVRVDAFIIKAALNYCTDAFDWQAEQDEPGVIRLAVAVLPGRELDAARLRFRLDEQLALYGLTGLVRIEPRGVSRIAPDPRTGKVRRSICRTGPAETPR
jgi:phenylacetate-CoA ligase